jgi:hypothetical protein
VPVTNDDVDHRQRSLRGTLRRFGKRALQSIPELSAVFEERDRLRAELEAQQRVAPGKPEQPEKPQLYPPGHYHSPIPDLVEVRARAQALFDRDRRTLPGIDLRESGQLELLRALIPFYDEQPWSDDPAPPLRYYFLNPFYSYADALFLYGMIRHLRPASIVEIGSGYSSCVTLDTNELCFGNAIACTFIEPNPEVLRSLLRPGDETRVRLVASPLQDVDLEEFRRLRANDILFVDSTHVSRIGSDVHTILFEILPALRPGVFIHFHDIFHPFEYPEPWVLEGRQWHEAYLLRAFLQFNESFEIVLFNTFLWQFHRDVLAREMPLCLKNPGGSLWLRRK